MTTETQTPNESAAEQPKDATLALMIMAEASSHAVLDEEGIFGEGEEIGCREIVHVATSVAIRAVIIAERHPEWKDRLLAEFGGTVAENGGTWDAIYAELDEELATAEQAASETHAEQPEAADEAEPDYFGDSFTPHAAPTPSLPRLGDMLAGEQAKRRLEELSPEERELGMVSTLIADTIGQQSGYSRDGAEVRYGCRVAEAAICAGFELVRGEPAWVDTLRQNSLPAKLGFAEAATEAARALLRSARTMLRAGGF